MALAVLGIVFLLLVICGLVLLTTARRVFRLVGVLVLGAAVLLVANAWVAGASVMKITFGMGQ